MVGPAARGADDRPNVVLIVADDLGWADLGLLREQVPPDAEPRPAGRRGPAVHPGVRRQPGLLADPRGPDDRQAPGPAPPDRLAPRPARSARRRSSLRPAIRQELPLEEVTLAERLKAAGYATGIDRQVAPRRRRVRADPAGVRRQHRGRRHRHPAQLLGPVPPGRPDHARPRRRPRGPVPHRPPGDRGRAVHRGPQGRARSSSTCRTTPSTLPMVAKAGDRRQVPEVGRHPARPAGEPDLRGDARKPRRRRRPGASPRSTGSGLADRTIVIFTSDNGGLATREGPNTPATINAPLREGKGWLYEGGLRVPLIVRWPGQIAPGVEETPAWAADLARHHRRLCRPARRPRARRRRAWPACSTEGKPLAPRPLYWHYPHYSNQGGRPGGAIRDGDWKLVESFETGRRELFDLAPRPAASRTTSPTRSPRRSATWPRSWRTGGRAVGARDAHAQPRLLAQPPGRRRLDHPAGLDGRGPRRDAPVRAPAAQEHAGLLDPPRRLGLLGVRRPTARRVRRRGAGRLRQRERRQRRRVPRRRPGAPAHRARHRRLPELRQAAPRPGLDRRGRPAPPGSPGPLQARRRR